MSVRPGKTAPRLLEDLLIYDPRYEAAQGRNVLTDPPPQFDPEKSRPVQSRQGCRHALMEKPSQSKLPVPGHAPESSTIYYISCYCTECRFHFNITVDFSGAHYIGAPCPNEEYPLHHLIHVVRRDSPRADPSLSPEDSTHHFQCTAKDCPLELHIRIRPPTFKTSWVELLSSQDNLTARHAAAMHADPARYDLKMASPWEGLSYLRRYLLDSLNPNHVQNKIPARNRKFMVTFGSDCDHILQKLGFRRIEGEDENQLCWGLPQSGPESDSFDADSLRAKLEDTIAELTSLILKRPSTELKLMIKPPEQPRPCLTDIERALGCLDYAKDPASRRSLSRDVPEHPFYASLGVLSNFADNLVTFAYERQVESDPFNASYYFECLEDLARGRNSENLQIKVSTLMSQGQTNRKQIRDAYKYFNIDPSLPHSGISDDYIIGQFRARLADVSSSQEGQMREMLRILGQARQSAVIQQEASNSIETVAQAMHWLGVDESTEEGFIVTMASIKLEEPASMENARKAVQIIADHRNSDFLRTWVATGQVGQSAMDLAEAYRILDIPDRTATIDQELLTTLLEMRMTESSHPTEKLQEAYALISKSKFGVSDDATAETSGHPPEKWPVGFQNIGNTCYLNSLLQYFFTIRPLRELVLDFDKHKLELTAENTLKKRVGGREVTIEEVEKAQEFVQELKKLFNGMITSSSPSVRPEVRLACLALLSTKEEVQRRQSINEKGAGLGNINGAPVIGPMPMATVTDETTAVNGASPESQTEMGDTGSEGTLVATPASSNSPEDGEPKSEGVKLTSLGPGTTDTDAPPQLMKADETMSDAEVPAAPNRPPPVPPRPQMTDVSRTTVPADVEFAARQQDVAEVMNKVVFQLQCAIKPEVLSSGQSIDLTKRLFFGETTTTHARKNKVERRKESWDTLFVNVNEGPRDIYSALDEEFDKGDIEEEARQAEDKGILSKYENISILPPVVQINVKRVNYDTQKHETFKSHNHLHLEDTLYFDRYLEQTSSVSEKDLYDRRLRSWEWKKRLRVLRNRQQELQKQEDGNDLADTAEVAADYLVEREADSNDMAVDGVEPEVPLAEALRKRAVELRQEQESLTKEIKELQDKIEALFVDLQDHPYRLHAIFMHRGSAGGGHYWVYIRDFQSNMWRKYNDTKVEEVSNLEEIFGEDKTKPPATSTGVVYVQDSNKEKLTEALCRRLQKADVEMVDVEGVQAQVIEGVEV